MSAACSCLTRATSARVSYTRCSSIRFAPPSALHTITRARKELSSRYELPRKNLLRSLSMLRSRPYPRNGAIALSIQADSSQRSCQELSKGPKINLPTTLTLLRVAAVPCITVLFYMQGVWVAPACSAIFILAAITDWADGFLARKLKLGSSFGAFLDPVADKLMVATTLVLMCTKAPPSVNVSLISIPATLIIGREITMSAIREWAAAAGGKARDAVAVNSYGKLKTATQLVALSVLLGVRDGCGWVHLTGASEVWLINSGLICLWLSAGLALISLWIYMAGVVEFMS